MELILRALQNLGGEASKSDVKPEIAKMDDAVADYINLTKERKLVLITHSILRTTLLLNTYIMRTT